MQLITQSGWSLVSYGIRGSQLFAQVEAQAALLESDELIASVRREVNAGTLTRRLVGLQEDVYSPRLKVAVVNASFSYPPLGESLEEAVRLFAVARANETEITVDVTVDTGNIVYGAVYDSCTSLSNYTWVPDAEVPHILVELPSQAGCADSDAVGLLYYRKAPLFLGSQVDIISVNFRDGSRNLSSELVVQLRTPEEEGSGFDCVFWDFDLEKWNGAGCRLVSKGSSAAGAEASLPAGFARCACDHTTHFSVLTGSSALSALDALVLSRITYAGLGISVPLLLVIFAIFTLIRALHSPTHFLMSQLSLSLAVALLLFVIGADRTANAGVCTGVAIALHYFLLVSFAWMLLNGHLLYRKFCRVLETVREHFHPLRLLGFAWGVPAVIVLVAAASRPDAYGTEQACWIEDGPVLWAAFLAPVGVVILINLALFAMILRVILRLPQYTHLQKEQTERAVTLTRAFKAFTVLLPVMGGTWVLAYLTIKNDLVFLHYLFTLGCSLQGLLIFIFHFALDHQVQQWTLRQLRRSTILPSSQSRHEHSRQAGHSGTGVPRSTEYSQPKAQHSGASSDKAHLTSPMSTDKEYSLSTGGGSTLHSITLPNPAFDVARVDDADHKTLDDEASVMMHK